MKMKQNASANADARKQENAPALKNANAKKQNVIADAKMAKNAIAPKIASANADARKQENAPALKNANAKKQKKGKPQRKKQLNAIAKNNKSFANQKTVKIHIDGLLLLKCFFFYFICVLYGLFKFKFRLPAKSH